MGIVTGQQALAADVVVIGAGHITINLHSYDSIGQGTWLFTQHVDYLHNYFSANESDTNGDNVSFKVYLAKGTYTMRILYGIASTLGIVDVDLDGVEKTSFDCYNASASQNNIDTTTGIVVATLGLKTIRLRIDGKNGSSSGYKMRINALDLWRTS